MSKLTRSLTWTRQLLLALQPFSPVRRAAARRWLLWRLLREEADTIAFRRDGIRWAGPVRSSITAQLFTRGNYQHECMPAVRDWLAAHQPRWATCGTIVNVGANIGDTAIGLTLRTGKRVLACEPVPELFRLLQDNIAANGLQQQITGRACAIASTIGEAEIICPPEPEYSEMRGGNGAQGFHHPAATCQAFRVPTITLEGWLERESVPASDVALVWSDTQGFESEVITSGARLWTAGVPLWVEVWPRGLKVHGGVDRFVNLTRRYFRQFVTENQLVEKGKHSAAGDIAGLERLVESLRGRAFTDVLLIP
jgi:FkbM family methyltransferase